MIAILAIGEIFAETIFAICSLEILPRKRQDEILERLVDLLYLFPTTEIYGREMLLIFLFGILCIVDTIVLAYEICAAKTVVAILAILEEIGIGTAFAILRIIELVAFFDIDALIQ